MKNKGFSFVELLVAVAILGIVSLPIISSFALATKTDSKAYHLSAMNDAADDIVLMLEEMTVETTDDFDLEIAFLSALSEYYSEAFERLSEDELEFSYNGYRVFLTVKDLENSFCRVDVRVEYLFGDDPLAVERREALRYA